MEKACFILLLAISIATAVPGRLIDRLRYAFDNDDDFDYDGDDYDDYYDYDEHDMRYNYPEEDNDANNYYDYSDYDYDKSYDMSNEYPVQDNAYNLLITRLAATPLKKPNISLRRKLKWPSVTTKSWDWLVKKAGKRPKKPIKLKQRKRPKWPERPTLATLTLEHWMDLWNVIQGGRNFQLLPLPKIKIPKLKEFDD